MSLEVETFDAIILIALVIASVCTTAFPLLYSLSPWHKSILGRTMMAQSIAFSLAVDLTLLFRFWMPPYPWGRFVTMLVLLIVAGTTATLTGILWKLNYTNRLNEEQDDFDETTFPDQQGL